MTAVRVTECSKGFRIVGKVVREETLLEFPMLAFSRGNRKGVLIKLDQIS